MSTSDQASDALDLLRAKLRGPVIAPGQPGYDDARKVWNAMFDDRRPLAVVRCVDEDDVAAAVRCLRGTGAPIAIRGGGHHIAGFGTCDAGFVIDMGAMRTVVPVDDGGSRVRVAGGATLHDVDTATDAVGRAVPLGVVSPTGVAGLTLSGGLGWLTRRHGYTCDNLVSARVVTAEGEVVVASERENPELLWALRGGGGNFGVVTEFEFETHPVGPVAVAEAYYPAEREDELVQLLRFYRDWTAELPDAVTAWIMIERASDGHELGADALGKLVVGLLACSLETSGRDRAALEPMLREGSPALTRTTTMSMLDLQHLQDGGSSAATGMHSYMKGEMLTELTDSAIAGIAHHSTQLPTETSLFEMGQLGGALAQRGELDAAVGLRHTRYLGGFSMMSTDGANLDEHIAWTRKAWSSMTDGSAGGVYLNFSGDESRERVMGSLGAAPDDEKRRRLVDLKRRYDPDNVFRVNHNIDPGS